jgi:hypothetical protein
LRTKKAPEIDIFGTGLPLPQLDKTEKPAEVLEQPVCNVLVVLKEGVTQSGLLKNCWVRPDALHERRLEDVEEYEAVFEKHIFCTIAYS